MLTPPPRSYSPPPMPSPQLLPTPLPSPPFRRRAISAKLTQELPHSPASPRSTQRSLQSIAKPCDHHDERSRRTRPSIDTKKSINTTFSRDRSPGSTMHVSPPSTPRSLPPHTSRSRRSKRASHTHRRSLSLAVPYLSPPPSPKIEAPPPPVPPIPKFVLSPTDRKPVLRSPSQARHRQSDQSQPHPQSSQVRRRPTAIYIQIDDTLHLGLRPAVPTPASARSTSSGPKRTRSAPIPMTCFGFLVHKSKFSHLAPAPATAAAV